MKSFNPLENIDLKGLTSLIIQGLLFGANIAILINDRGNLYTVISMIFLLSLFVLQSINRRFLFLHPVSGFMNESVSFIDTKILKLFILLSAFFLFLSTNHLVSQCEDQPIINMSLTQKLDQSKI